METKIREIVKEEMDKYLEIQFDKFKELLPPIINSATKTIEHHTAQDTNKRLNKLEDGYIHNQIEHRTIQQSLDKIESFLQDIKQGIEARNWLRKWLKDWWLLISIVITSIALWIKREIEK